MAVQYSVIIGVDDAQDSLIFLLRRSFFLLADDVLLLSLFRASDDGGLCSNHGLGAEVD